MPSIAQVPQDGVAGRKRRWEDSGEVVRVCSPNLKHTSRSESTTHPYDSNHTPHTSHASLLEEKQLQHLEFRERERRILPIPSRRESHKRQRISPQASHNLAPTRERIEERTEGARGEVTPAKKTNLSPCHICHRKPTVKAELDNFADCEGCRKRTCWICIRECLGSAVGVGRDVEMDGHDSHGGGGERREERREEREDHADRERDGRREGDTGHKGMVCSRCCVERGTEGEVWCFGCLRNEGGG